MRPTFYTLLNEARANDLETIAPARLKAIEAQIKDLQIRLEFHTKMGNTGLADIARSKIEKLTAEAQMTQKTEQI